jgi:hypothetical protein
LFGDNVFKVSFERDLELKRFNFGRVSDEISVAEDCKGPADNFLDAGEIQALERTEDNAHTESAADRENLTIIVVANYFLSYV